MNSKDGDIMEIPHGSQQSDIPFLQPKKSTKSDKVTLNYKSVYGTLDRPRKRPLAYKSRPGPPEDSGKYVSKHIRLW